MAWIKAEQSLRNHPKMRKAAAMLEIAEPHMVGYLLYLWWWAVDYATDGDLGKYTHEDIEFAVAWRGVSGAFVAACLECGFGDGPGFLVCVDGALHIHDWDDYAGDLLAARARNAERMRKKRAANMEDTCNERATNVQRTCSARVEKSREEREEQQYQSADATEIVTFWQNNIGTIGKFARDKLIAYVTDDGMESALVIYAIEKAIAANVRRLDYVEAILKDWAAENIKTRAVAEAQQRPRSAAGGGDGEKPYRPLKVHR